MITVSAPRWWRGWGIPAAAPRAVYAPQGAASQAASYANLEAPGVDDAAPVVAPNWTAAAGWAFTGTQYLSSVTPANTQNSWTMMIRYSDAGAFSVSQCLGGYNLAGDRGFSLFSSVLNKVAFANGSLNYSSTGASQASGTLAISAGQGYRNGVADGTSASYSTTGWPIFLGAASNSGALRFPFSGKIRAVAIYSAALSASQILALHIEMMRRFA